MFLEVALFLEIFPVLKKSWLHAWSTTMVGWQRKLLGFGPARTFTLSMILYTKSHYFKAYFSFTWHLEYTDLLQFRHKCIYLLLATNWKNK